MVQTGMSSIATGHPALASLCAPDDATAGFILGVWFLLFVALLARGLWRRKRPLVPRGTCAHGVLLDEPCAICIAVMKGKHVDLDGDAPVLRDTVDEPQTPEAAVPLQQDPVSGVVETPTPEPYDPFPETPTPDERPRVPPPPPTGPRGTA